MKLRTETGKSYFYQWDTNQILIVEGAPECQQVHFGYRDGSGAIVCNIREVDGKRVVDVPNELLQKDRTFFAYLIAPDNDGTQIPAQSFVVLMRPKPDDYVYTETEVQTYEALEERIAALEENGGSGISCTHEWDGTVLTVTSASGTSSADLKGEKGDTGEKGDVGPQGIQGEPGHTPVIGENGNWWLGTTDTGVSASGDGIEVNGAEVGQTIQVSAVDENGMPTEWEAVDFPSGQKWIVAREYSAIEEDVDVFTVSVPHATEIEFRIYGIANDADNTLTTGESNFAIWCANWAVARAVMYLRTSGAFQHDGKILIEGNMATAVIRNSGNPSWAFPSNLQQTNWREIAGLASPDTIEFSIKTETSGIVLKKGTMIGVRYKTGG